eukprot:Lankesteria_metandrocarpae@DN8234_c0_g1_i1.p1
MFEEAVNVQQTHNHCKVKLVCSHALQTLIGTRTTGNLTHHSRSFHHDLLSMASGVAQQTKSRHSDDVTHASSPILTTDNKCCTPLNTCVPSALHNPNGTTTGSSASTAIERTARTLLRTVLSQHNSTTHRITTGVSTASIQGAVTFWLTGTPGTDDLYEYSQGHKVWRSRSIALLLIFAVHDNCCYFRIVIAEVLSYLSCSLLMTVLGHELGSAPYVIEQCCRAAKDMSQLLTCVLNVVLDYYNHVNSVLTGKNTTGNLLTGKNTTGNLLTGSISSGTLLECGPRPVYYRAPATGDGTTTAGMGTAINIVSPCAARLGLYSDLCFKNRNSCTTSTSTTRCRSNANRWHSFVGACSAFCDLLAEEIASEDVY